MIRMRILDPQRMWVSQNNNSNQPCKKGICSRLFIFDFFGCFVFNCTFFTSGTLARAKSFDEGCEFSLVHLAYVFRVELMERNILE